LRAIYLLCMFGDNFRKYNTENLLYIMINVYIHINPMTHINIIIIISLIYLDVQ